MLSWCTSDEFSSVFLVVRPDDILILNASFPRQRHTVSLWTTFRLEQWWRAGKAQCIYKEYLAWGFFYIGEQRITSDFFFPLQSKQRDVRVKEPSGTISLVCFSPDSLDLQLSNSIHQYMLTNLMSLHLSPPSAHETYWKAEEKHIPPKLHLRRLANVLQSCAWPHQHSTALSRSRFQGKRNSLPSQPIRGAITTSLQSI